MAYKLLALTTAVGANAILVNEKYVIKVVESGSGAKVTYLKNRIKEVVEVTESVAAILALSANLIQVTVDGLDVLLHNDRIVELANLTVYYNLQSTEEKITVAESRATMLAAVNAL